jgi:hypothetical protein
MMSLPLYRSRVIQSFHRLSTLGPPLVFVMVSLAWSVAMLLYTRFLLTPEMDLPEEIFHWCSPCQLMERDVFNSRTCGA